MNTHDTNKHDENDLRQQLLELHYGCHENPAALEARLAADPELRKLYDEIRAASGVLDAAARSPMPALSLRRPDGIDDAPAGRVHPLRRWKVAAAVLVVLLTIPFGHWGWRASQAADAEREAFRLVLSGPPSIPDLTTSRFHVETWNLENRPIASRITWRVLDEAGAVLLEDEARGAGTFELEIPPQKRPLARLEVVAEARGVRETAAVDLSRAESGLLVQLTTDKPVYEPGDTVRYRGVFLDRLTFKDRNGQYNLRVVDAKNIPVFQVPSIAVSGVAAGQWTIPANQLGGTFAVEMRDLRNEFTIERHEFVVRRFEKPRLKKDVTLDRETYAAGSTGKAEVEFIRIDGQLPAAGAHVNAQVVLDGATVWQGQATLDVAGKASFDFELPMDVKRGDARFVASAADGGIVETAVEPFIVPTGKVAVTFYPESGDLIVGAPGRVYAEVTDALDRPLSASGRVVDGSGRTVAAFQTAHQGRARFDLGTVVESGYKLVLDTPLAREFRLPTARTGGCVLKARKDVTAAGDALQLEAWTSGPGPWVVAAFCRGVQVGQDTFAGSGRHDVTLDLARGTGGVLRVTLFNGSLVPVAERLVHRESGRSVVVDLVPSKTEVAPGESQEVTVRTRTEDGTPISAVVGLTVVDRASEAQAGEPRIGLADHTWLFGDVEDLEDIEEFLLAEDDDAPRNIDLLLGTQGWRRFGWRDVKTFVKNEGDRAKAWMVKHGSPLVPAVVDTADPADLERVRAAHEETERAGRQALAALIVAGALLIAGLFTARATRHVAGGPARAALGVVVFAAVLGSAVMWLVERDAPGPRNDVVASYEIAEEPVSAAVQNYLYFTPLPQTVTATRDTTIVPPPALGRGVPPNGGSGAGPQNGLPIILGGMPGPVPGGGGPGAAAPGVPVQGVAKVDWLANDITRGGDGGGGQPPGAGIFFNDIPVEIAQGAFAFNLVDNLRAPNEINLIVGQAELREANKNVFLRGRFNGMPWGPGDAGRRSAYGYVRSFAHKRSAQQNAQAGQAGARSDFTSTVYWNAALATDHNGEAKVAFDVSDRVTTWDVHADAHGAGRVGQATESFQARLPFRIEAVLPIEVTRGDVLDLPLVAIAREGLDSATLDVAVTGPVAKIADGGAHRLQLVAGRARTRVRIEMTGDDKPVRVVVKGKAGEFRDALDRWMRVVPRGFPRHFAKSGVLTQEKPIDVTIPMPELLVDGTLRARLKLFPSTLSTLTDGLAGLLRTPGGCFEQASSSNYPNVLALTLMQELGHTDAAIANRSRSLLARGYKLIAGYECPKKGYEWFGGDPGHEALTAYGLLEFHDMKRVWSVDEEMVKRTREWLLARRDGQGGFLRNAKALDSFGRAPKEVTDTYITYALAVTGVPVDDIKDELAVVRSRALESDDPYVVAVAACALAAAGRKDTADAARERLKELQRENGELRGTTSSITRSGGRDLSVETTAFAILAWLEDENDVANVERAVEYLQSCRGHGRFGATQATVMALKALCAHAAKNNRIPKEGVLRVWVNDAIVQTIRVQPGHKGKIELADLHRHLQPGIANNLRMEVSGENTLPWSLDVDYVADKPADDSDAPVLVKATLGSAVVAEGSTVPLTIKVKNRFEQEGLPMAMAIVGIPAGLEAPTKVLDDLKEAGRFGLWEIRGRELVLYWRCLAPGEEKSVTLDMVARIPGTTTGPASRAYLYYTPDRKSWADPVTITVE